MQFLRIYKWPEFQTLHANSMWFEVSILCKFFVIFSKNSTNDLKLCPQHVVQGNAHLILLYFLGIFQKNVQKYKI